MLKYDIAKSFEAQCDQVTTATSVTSYYSECYVNINFSLFVNSMEYKAAGGFDIQI